MVHTEGMKTAVSIPDDLFQSAECAAADMGVTRSKFFALALAEYLRRLQEAEISVSLNEVYADEDSSLPPDIRASTSRQMSRLEW